MDLEKRILVIPHSHYDVAWIRTEGENLRRMYGIFSKVLDIMTRDKEFKYVVDQVFYLERMKKQRPELFRQIAERISEGRIEVVNAGYVMPDLNLVSPFTILKSFEVMNDFAQEEFNVKPHVAWMIDCFGHPGIMPKVARGANLKNYVFWRGMNRPDFSQEFFWRGADGSTVLTHWMKQGYSLFGSRFNNLAQAIQTLEPATNLSLLPFGDDFYIPQEKLIQQIHKTKNAEFALPSEFFKELEKQKSKLPTLEGEMLSDYSNFKGYYSSRISLKQLFRKAERELLDKGGGLEDWKNLLYTTFHDLIGGTGIDAVYPAFKKKLKRIKKSRKTELDGKCCKDDFLGRVSFELRYEEGDLYHTKPTAVTDLPKNSVRIKSCFNNPTWDILVQTDFQSPGHVLKLLVNTSISDGKLTQRFWPDSWVERKLNTLYAFNNFFEYKDKNGSGLRFNSDDCFDYEIKNNGVVYLTLVRSVQILSHGDAGPKIPCPKALELGKHSFKLSVTPVEKGFTSKT
jgi:alpha-mannosidase